MLTAGAYRGGRLDWSDFTASTQPRPSGAPTAVVKRVTSTKLPVPLDFAGGPARRYFELETSGTSLSLLAGAPHDLATALLLEVALVYGGDWFVLPLELPVGSLARVDSITLVDAFGLPTAISGRLRSPGWRAFECAPTTDPASELLAILPTVALPLEGEPIESIALVRDERANVVWAIEDVAPDALGIGRTISHPTPTVPAEATYTYVPFVPPPASWFPLVRRDGDLVGATFHGVAAPLVPRGRMLGGWPAIKFLADDVHDDGLRIERRWQVAFGRDRARVAWISRTDRSAGAPASSGIAADVLVLPSEP